jgi:hypothetical protein
MANKIEQQSRRNFLKKVGYTAPVILTINAAPAFAKNGSSAQSNGNNGIGQEKRGLFDGPPPGLATKPNQDFNDNGSFAPLGESGAQAGGRPE